MTWKPSTILLISDLKFISFNQTEIKDIMEIEIGKKSTVRKTVFYILGFLLLVFMIYYVVMSLLGPRQKITAINSEYGYKPPENSKSDERIFSNSAFISISREMSFSQARVLMAESDSICLALNLSDSTAILEINGVMMHNAKVSEIAISKVIEKADEYSVSAMLATPFTIRNDYATLKKEPLMIKMAPKDTSEYKPDILPDTINSEAVNYMFEMENGTRLYVYQNVGENEGGGLNLFFFDLNDRLRNIRDNLKSIIALKVPEYHPSIKIRIAKADAKIIYRALPKHGQIAVFR